MYNGLKMKKCPKCEVEYTFTFDRMLQFFTKQKSKKDGLDCICKRCRRHYRQLNKDKELLRWNKYYAKGTEARKRHIIRSQTRRKHGPANQFICKKCNSSIADEWHHETYTTDGAIPVCHPCHEMI